MSVLTIHFERFLILKNVVDLNPRPSLTEWTVGVYLLDPFDVGAET